MLCPHLADGDGFESVQLNKIRHAAVLQCCSPDPVGSQSQCCRRQSQWVSIGVQPQMCRDALLREIAKIKMVYFLIFY